MRKYNACEQFEASLTIRSGWWLYEIFVRTKGWRSPGYENIVRTKYSGFTIYEIFLRLLWLPWSCGLNDASKVAGDISIFSTAISIHLYIFTSCLARHCSGIRAPRWTLSLCSRSKSLALLSFLASRSLNPEMNRRPCGEKLRLHDSSMEKEAKLISNGKRVTQVEHHGVQQLGKKSKEKSSYNVRLPQL